MLEPCAGKLARTVLRGPRRREAPGLPDNTAADHITVLREALRQLPGHRQGTAARPQDPDPADAAGCTHELLDWLVGQRLSYSVGFTLPDTITDELAKIP